MARKARARRPSRARTARPQRAARPSSASPKDRIIDALMALAAMRDFAKVGLADIAEEAGVSLATLRESYDGKLAIVADFSRRIDQAVLEGGPAEGETPRDRLFEILMRRFDALGPYKAAVRNIARAARRDLCLGRYLHRNSRRSQIWSMAPCSTRNSERWKPSGSVSRTVCSITRGPAKPIRASVRPC